MSKTAIYLPELKPEELERIEEIKFFLFTSKLIKLARGSGLEDDYTLIRPLITITNTSENLMEAAIATMNSIAAKPHELEIAITAKAMAYPYRLIEKRVMYASKYKKALHDYLNDRTSNMLLPKCPPEITAEIVKFNKEMYNKMTYIYVFLHGEVDQKGIDTWDS